MYDKKDAFKTAMGDVRIIFEIRKGRSIGSIVVKNKGVSIEVNSNGLDQKCNAPGCMQCPLVSNANHLKVNNRKTNVNTNLKQCHLSVDL